ncbi:MAG: o-succinylbenzoate--CoA ligase [Vicinamibacterales bacterium]
MSVTTDWLRKRAWLTPSAPAVMLHDATLTFGELDERVDDVAAALAARGVGPGDRVALLLPNGLPFVELVHAVPRVGAILVPLNTRLTPAELSWQVADAGARLAVFDDSTDALAAGSSRDAARTHVAELHGHEQRLPAVEDGGLDRVHSIIYTSGTTGRPKGAMLTFGNHFWSAIGSALNLGLDPDDRLLACLPMFHVGGLAVLLRSAIYGQAAVVHESFDPQRVNGAIDDGVTVVSVVSRMLARMLEERGHTPYPSTLRAVLLGGGPAPQPLLEACGARGVPVVQTYGLTEAASQVATLAPADALRKLGSAGKPLFPTEIRIDRAGAEAAPGDPGEILVRGATVSPGYWNREDEPPAAFRDGWLRTGDVGRLDDEGYLYVLDRRDDLIISGGENVYPTEVEAVLLSHPSVAEAGVYGVADERWGAVPAASVVARPGASVTADELGAFCRERLAKYKVPVSIRFVEALPHTAAGKLLRRLLRDQETDARAP